MRVHVTHRYERCLKVFSHRALVRPLLSCACACGALRWDDWLKLLSHSVHL